MKVMLFVRVAALVAMCGLAFNSVSPARAAKPEISGSKIAAASTAEKVEMFEAIKRGDIEVRLIPQDSRSGNVLITNKTKKPLTIKLPEAFVGLPVLAQFGGGGLGGGGMGGMGGGGMGGMGGMQAMGGGMGGMGGGGMGGGGMGGMGGGGGGLFNVPAEKVGKIKVTTVCLEHGKTDPSPRVAYELKPIESFTNKAEVVELCKMLGRGEIAQNSAQAATWHLANGLSWGELAHKIKVKHLDGSTEPYFVHGEIQAAFRIATEAVRRGKEHPIKTPGKEDSLSQK